MNKDNTQIVAGLHNTLANSYALYLKLQNYHWNVEGANFSQLHEMFAEQYQELADAIDVIAERIRALGAKVPASFTIFAKAQLIAEANENNNWRQMVQDLHSGHITLAKIVSDLLKLAMANGDEVTADIMIGRLTIHEKNAWILKSTLAD